MNACIPNFGRNGTGEVLAYARGGDAYMEQYTKEKMNGPRLGTLNPPRADKQILMSKLEGLYRTGDGRFGQLGIPVPGKEVVFYQTWLDYLVDFGVWGEETATKVARLFTHDPGAAGVLGFIEKHIDLYGSGTVNTRGWVHEKHETFDVLKRAIYHWAKKHDECT